MCVTVKIERDIVGSERDREEKETYNGRERDREGVGVGRAWRNLISS